LGWRRHAGRIAAVLPAKRSQWVGGVLALGIFLGCSSDVPTVAQGRADGSVEAPAQIARARIQTFSGAVNVKRAAGDDWILAREGMELYENDKVRTSKGASVHVETPNGELSMGEDALLAIPEERGNVTLLQGHLDAHLDPTEQTLTIKTPAAEVRAGREIFIQ